MNYELKDYNKYKIYYAKTNDFKYTTINIRFKKKIEKQDLINLYMITNLLKESSKNYKSYRQISLKIEDLYSPIISFASYRTGNISNFELRLNILDDKYTEVNSLNKSLEFACDLLFNPDIINNSWNENSFNRVKKVLEEDILSLKEHPKEYSIMQAKLAYDKESCISYDVFNVEQLEEITPKSLYEYYINFINKSIIDVYIAGNNIIDIVNNNLNKYIKSKILKKNELNYFIDKTKLKDKIKVVKEKINNKESRLILIYKIKELSEFDTKYTMNILNYILGASENSMLFKSIREENSMCYYVYSSYFMLDNILTINLGINNKNYNKVRELIDLNIKNLNKGKFDDKEIDNYINYSINIVNSIYDSQYSLINHLKSLDINKDSLEDRINNYKKVTKKDIIKASKKIEIDTIYELVGDMHE